MVKFSLTTTTFVTKDFFFCVFSRESFEKFKLNQKWYSAAWCVQLPPRTCNWWWVEFPIFVEKCQWSHHAFVYMWKSRQKNHNKSEIFFFLFGWGKLNRRKIEILIEEKLVTLKFTFVFDWKTLITRIQKILEVKINFFFEISPLQALNFPVLQILQ